MLKKTLTLLALIAAIGLFADYLDDGFAAPPVQARPQTWWHWMNCNITKEGIKKDIDAMYKAGIQLDGGLGFSYRVSDRSNLFLELEADVIADAPAFWRKGVGFHHSDVLATVGYIFNLGVTAADQELIAQRALITKDQMDALEDDYKI